MPQGLQVWSAGGVSIFETKDAACRIIGSVETGGANGSRYVDFSAGRPWVQFIPYTYNPNNPSVPKVYLSGWTIIWEYFTATKTSGMIIYGIY